MAGLLAWAVLRAPDVPFLVDDGTPWILAPTPLQTHGMRIESAHPPTSFFEARFQVAEAPKQATLRVRALRGVSLWLNGEPLPVDDRSEGRWKEAATLDVASRLAPGENVLLARVVNPEGNPALQLRLDGLDPPLQTDTTWRSAWEGDPVAQAVPADDAMLHPERSFLPSPIESVAKRAVPLGALGVAGSLLFLWVRARPRVSRWTPTVATAGVVAFWALLFFRVLPMPAEVGFDSEAHLAYVRWLLEKHALPTARDGSAMYHPPLFYGLAALVQAALGTEGIAARAGVLAIPMLSGLSMAFVARGMARLLRPGETNVEAATVVVAGLLPMSLTLSTCVSNESLHALLASLAIFWTVRALVRERTPIRDDLVVGAFLAAALLVKYTSLVLLPILLGALAVKRVLAEPGPVSRAITGAALGIGLVAALSGWFYLGNYRTFGDPLVWNLNATAGETWWQLPGFHTAAYFTGFGESLTHPWFSSLHSFWDGLYTTLWGDGLLSGAIGPGSAARRWRYDWMAVVFFLALPATALLAVGWGRAAWLALRGEDLGRRLAWSLLVLLPAVFLGSLVMAILRYPFWSGGKAFYALLLTPTLALLVVLGFEALDRVLARPGVPVAVRSLPHAWALAFVGAIVWAHVG